MPRAIDNAATDVSAPTKGNKTFHYTGKKQTFIVPAGVTQVTVVAHGGMGGGFNYYPSNASPGFPGRVYATIPVQPGDKLYVFVGGSGKHGGFNGGAPGGTSEEGRYAAGYAGGGASDVRLGGDALKDRIIVAAGGGGAGAAVYTYGYGYGGDGGGLFGKSGGGGGSGASGGGGAGGTQSEGGSGGPGGVGGYSSSYDKGQPGGNGSLWLGGNGGNSSPYYYGGGGGGGGGGYYGGGGGGGGATFYVSQYYASEGGGGGGGSSYVEPNAIKSRMWTGWDKAQPDGLIVFSWK